jgi:hypothetical protein
LRCFSKDGLIGVSPLMRSGGAVSLAMAQAELAQVHAERGHVPDMAFETDQAFTGDMADAAFQRLKDQLEHRTFKWTHDQRLQDGSRIAKMQNSSSPTNRPML